MRVLIDSDALFASFVATDPNHEVAKKLIKDLAKKKATLVVINLVIQETATVISYKISQQASLKFLKVVGSLHLDTMTLNESLERGAWKIFKQQTKKRTSFIDCANLAAIEKFSLDGILSFDRFYPASLRTS